MVALRARAARPRRSRRRCAASRRAAVSVGGAAVGLDVRGMEVMRSGTFFRLDGGEIALDQAAQRRWERLASDGLAGGGLVLGVDLLVGTAGAERDGGVR